MIGSNAAMTKRRAVLCLLLLCIFLLQGSATEVEDEWDALDAPTKELYEDEASNKPAPVLASEGREKEAAEAIPVRQALQGNF